MSILYVVCQMNSYHFVPRGLVIVCFVVGFLCMFHCGLMYTWIIEWMLLIKKKLFALEMATI
jgi:hypothetical protein